MKNRLRVSRLIRKCREIISWLIFLNFLSIAMSTMQVFKPYSRYLLAFDDFCMSVFVIEMTVRAMVGGRSFFFGRNRVWNWFDLIVTSCAAFSSIPAFSALRAARLLRLFISMRLLSSVRHLRILSSSLMKALPSVGWLGLLLLMVNIIYTVMATIMFGETFPERYGDLGSSFYAMVELMTMEGWTDVAREVMAVYPWAWLFYISYILFAAYILLNAVSGVIVDGMMSPQTEASTERETEMLQRQQELDNRMARMQETIDRLTEICTDMKNRQ